MTIAMVYVGDSCVTLTAHQALDRNDPLPFHYTLHFRDLPTGKVAELSYTGENDALLALAAWIASDEPNIGVLETQRARLQSDLPAGFMP